MRARYRPTTWRAALWAVSATRQARRIAEEGLHTGAITSPPDLPPDARPGVTAALAAAREICLVRSLVLQEWDAAHGRPRDLIIGVRSDGAGETKAHAWLDGDREGYGFVELSRRPARRTS